MRISTTILAIAAIGVMAHAGTPSEWTKSWPISGKAEIRLDVDDGRVVVLGTESRTMEARVVVTGWEIGPSGVQVVEHLNGNRVEMTVKVPKNVQFLSVNRSVRVELRIPNGGAAEIHTGDGSIRAEQLKAWLRLRTGDGSIEVSRLDGWLEAETGDGSIRVAGRLDGLKLHTGDGSVEADLDSGSKMSGPWDISTGDGHVSVRLPENFAAEVNLKSSDGRVDVDFPNTTLPGGKSGGDVHAKLNGGGPPLTIRTGSGGVRLARR
jgi:hypothetical protein